MPRAAGRALCKTYGGNITAGRDTKNAGHKCRANKCRANYTANKCQAAGNGTRAAGRDTCNAGRRRGPDISGQKTAENRQKPKNRATRPRALAAQARAMFLTNNTVKNDMNVSRETLSLLTVEKMCIFVVLFAVF